MRRQFCLLLWCGLGAAQAAPDLPVLRLPAGSSEYKLPATGFNHAVLAIRLLDMPVPLAEAAAHLSPQFQPPLAVLPDGDGLILTTEPPSDWLLQLRPRGERSLGVLSAMAGPPSAPASAAPPRWLPSGTVLRLRTHAGEGGTAVGQEVYTHATLAPKALARQLSERLKQAGWRPAVPVRAPRLVTAWTRGASRLTLIVVPLDGGSGLLALRTAGSPPGFDHQGVRDE